MPKVEFGKRKGGAAPSALTTETEGAALKLSPEPLNQTERARSSQSERTLVLN